MLGACTGGGHTAELEDYLQRLARPMGITAPKVQLPAVSIPPRAEALRIAIQGGKLDGLDFLRLRGCALQQTVARRNSSLGRIAPPSQRLLMELAFLRDAPPCIETLLSDGRNELAELIRDSAAMKREQLPALIFNATLGGREYRDFWRSRNAPQDYPRQTSSLVITALEQVAADTGRWLSGDYQADETRLELALSDIAQGDGGELLDALTRQTSYLNAVNAVIDQGLVAGPLCTDNLQPRAALVLRTVSRKFFVERIQVRGAQLSQRYYQLMTAIKLLESQLSTALVADYRAWQQERETRLKIGIAAPRRHVEQLQQLLGSCFKEFSPPLAQRKRSAY